MYITVFCIIIDVPHRRAWQRVTMVSKIGTTVLASTLNVRTIYLQKARSNRTFVSVFVYLLGDYVVSKCTEC